MNLTNTPLRLRAVAVMVATGQQALQQLCPKSPQNFGFHRWPFYSVEHLHLQALALPYLSAVSRLKFAKHTPWWLPVEAALERLRPPVPPAESGEQPE